MVDRLEYIPNYEDRKIPVVELEELQKERATQQDVSFFVDDIISIPV
jgi:hypothetical protein